MLNSRERTALDLALDRELRPMTIDELLAEQARGAQVLDTREPASFAAAHLEGSINVGLVGQYATWAGTVLDREHSIALVADPGTEAEHVVGGGAAGIALIKVFERRDRVAAHASHHFRSRDVGWR